MSNLIAWSDMHSPRAPARGTQAIASDMLVMPSMDDSATLYLSRPRLPCSLLDWQEWQKDMRDLRHSGLFNIIILRD